ncbi:hypothetical protein GCM10007857_63380 [Bradyrhizobium iriomotense]|uniref:Uncharacterized protein n=1 Tax=Bradyrhizobium iriomotense TaxID=441950 RepID=A0ABQ6B5H0_9BRAD|nr:hypothetical protein GCM10007857_63380 [Bradyrhizobium iriomotense]
MKSPAPGEKGRGCSPVKTGSHAAEKHRTSRANACFPPAHNSRCDISTLSRLKVLISLLPAKIRALTRAGGAALAQFAGSLWGD